MKFRLFRSLLFEFIIVVIYLLLYSNLMAQDSTNIELHYRMVLDARISEFQYSQPSRIMNFIPNIGTTTIVSNGQIKVAPSLSLSLSQFLRDSKEQKILNAKISSITKSVELEKKEDYNKIATLNKQINMVKEELKIKLDILTLKEKIHAYDSSRFANHQIDPDAFYRSKIDILTAQYELRLIYQKLSSLQFQIQNLYRYE